MARTSLGPRVTALETQYAALGKAIDSLPEVLAGKVSKLVLKWLLGSLGAVLVGIVTTLVVKGR